MADASGDGIDAPPTQSESEKDTPSAPKQAADGASQISVNEAGNEQSTKAPEREKRGIQRGKRDADIRNAKKEIRSLKRQLKKLDKDDPKRDTIKDSIKDWTSRLQKAIAVDWLANTAHSAGARKDVVDRIDQAKIRMVKDSSLEMDAAYAEDDKVILIKESMVKRVMKDIKALDKEDIVSRKYGSVRDPGRLKKSEAYHNLVVQQALLAHETTHAYDDHQGHAHEHNAHVERLLNEWESATDPAQKKALDEKVVKEYIGTVEIQAYREQEKYQFEMGEAPRMSKWMTIKADARTGQAVHVEKAEATQNILDWFEASGKKLEASDVARFMAHEPGARKWAADTPGARKWSPETPGARKWAPETPGARKWAPETPGARKWAPETPGARKWAPETPGARKWGPLLGGRVLGKPPWEIEERVKK